MKRILKNKKYTEISLYVIFTAFALMVLWRLVNSTDNLWITLSGAIDFVAKSFSTIIAGLILGYMLLPAVSSVEGFLKKRFKKKKGAKVRRRIYNLSVLIVILMLLVVVALLITFVFPPLITNIIQLGESMPEYIGDINKWYNESLKDTEIFNSEYTAEIMQNSQTILTNRVNDIVLTIITSVAKVVWYIVRSVFNIIISLFIAIYFLLAQRNLIKDTKELSRLKWGSERADSVLTVLKEVDKVFGKYISAKLIQAVIIFCVSQIIFIILDVNLSTLLAVILAVCNIVPYIGAFIGIIPPILLSLLDSPEKGLYVAIAMLVLQITDGNVIQPVLIGDKLGLKPFWVIVVVVLGGNWFGLVGILLSVPVAAVIGIFIDKYVRRQKRKLEQAKSVKP